MRKYLLSAAAIAALLTSGSIAFGMGGGGGGGGGGGSYGNGGSDTRSTDEYTTAVRLIKHQQYSDAIPHLGSALAAKPSDPDILNYLGYTHRMVGQTLSGDDQAREFHYSLLYYQRALSFDANHKGVHEYLGELYLQMHDQASAQKEMATLAALCPTGCDERDALTKAMAAAGATQASMAQPAMAKP
jgi:hypothetical protein